MHRRLPEDAPRPLPPREHVYQCQAKKRGMGLGLLQIFSLPFVVFLIVTMFTTSSMLGLAAFAVSGFVAYRWFKPKPETFRMSVNDNSLMVFAGTAKRPLAEGSLEDLENIVLDTKSIQPNIEGDSAIPAMRIVEAKPGFEIDVARIALEFTGGKRIILTDDFFPYTETTEAFGKMRVFLRKNGWLPEDERDTDR